MELTWYSPGTPSLQSHRCLIILSSLMDHYITVHCESHPPSFHVTELALVTSFALSIILLFSYFLESALYAVREYLEELAGCQHCIQAFLFAWLLPAVASGASRCLQCLWCKLY